MVHYLLSGDAKYVNKVLQVFSISQSRGEVKFTPVTEAKVSIFAEHGNYAIAQDRKDLQMPVDSKTPKPRKKK